MDGCRISYELGATILKMPMLPSGKLQQVVETSYCPVVVLGGATTDTEAFLRQLRCPPSVGRARPWSTTYSSRPGRRAGGQGPMDRVARPRRVSHLEPPCRNAWPACPKLTIRSAIRARIASRPARSAGAGSTVMPSVASISRTAAM